MYGSFYYSEKSYCQFCDNYYDTISALSKHIKINHPMEFLRAVSKYYSIATKFATPNVQAALHLMKTSVFGLDQFEVLLDPVLLI
jgi:hypothetical protein